MWVAMLEITDEVIEELGWIHKTSLKPPSKNINKKYKNVYKMLGLASMLESMMFDLVDLTYCYLFQRNCDICFKKHRTPFEIANQLVSDLVQLHRPIQHSFLPSLTYAYWHKCLYDNADWTKTTTVKEFIKTTVESVSNYHTCLIHDAECVNAAVELEPVVQPSFRKIMESLLLLSLSSNYECDVAVTNVRPLWRLCTPFESGTAVCKNLMSHVKGMMELGDRNRGNWIEEHLLYN